ncbi:MAG: hypothetical protein ACYSSL_08645 [Planctomycetota bacterium]|jgi:hypothetical protein
MNKMQTIAKITLVTLALFIILGFVKSILTTLPLLSHGVPSFAIFFTCLVIVTMGALSVLVAQQLIFKSEKWASKIVGYVDEHQSQEISNWLPIVYHLTVVISGILLLLWTINPFFGLISSIYIYFGPESDKMPLHPEMYLIPRLISVVIRLSLAIYLLYGAPHFVRWHVTKTLAQCHDQAVDK